jgi:hypothetical protein
MTTSPQAHWEHVYTTKREADVSWFQVTPAPSLDLLELGSGLIDQSQNMTVAAIHMADMNV